MRTPSATLKSLFALSAVIAVALVALTCPSLAAPLEELARPKDFTSHRVSSFDTTGGNADGGQGNPIRPGDTRVLAEISGPGQVRHIWITINSGDGRHLRNLRFRAWWDGEDEPSIDAPIGDFFCQGHATYTPISTMPVAVGNQKGLNCYWPMPFNQSARFTVTNEGDADCTAFYYYIDYEKHRKRFRDLRTFHAQYREEAPVDREDNYTFVYAEGAGHFVGVFHTVKQNEDGWWGEGDDMFFVDGEAFPSLHGTGSEDYFGHAWGMGKDQVSPYFGALMNEGYRKDARHSQYRWHVEDPIPFTKSLHFTMEHGHANDRADDFTSVAFWYQTEPHRSYGKPVPPVKIRSAQSDFMDALRREGTLADRRAEARRLAAAYPRSALIGQWREGLEWEAGTRRNAPSRGSVAVRTIPPGAVVIDGRLDESAWRSAEWADGFATRSGQSTALATRFAVARDGERLYVALDSAEDPDASPLRALGPEDLLEGHHESVIYNDDCVEIFFVPDPARLRYGQLILNRNLAWYDGSGLPGIHDHDGANWEVPLDLAASETPDRWTLEIALPLEALAEPPAPGDYWRLGVHRVRRWKDDTDREQSAFDRWPATEWLTGGHLSPLMGYLRF